MSTVLEYNVDGMLLTLGESVASSTPIIYYPRNLHAPLCLESHGTVPSSLVYAFFLLKLSLANRLYYFYVILCHCY